jgi:hypothetical protein
MTTPTAPFLLRRPRARLRRGDPLLAAVAAAAVAWLILLAALTGGLAGPSTASAPPSVALVVDAGARPDLALSRARAAAAAIERGGAADVTVRVPRTAADAATDVRYFAAQKRVARVVVVGPRAIAAARAAAAAYPRARFVARPAVPAAAALPGR